MSSKYNRKKSEQLGMPIGTAANRLRKLILFDLLQRFDLLTCHQCGQLIKEPRDLSVEHIVPWLDSKDPVGLFFDLDNISFSHLSCNVAAKRYTPSAHGTPNRYCFHGCRCPACTEANTKVQQRYRARKALDFGE